MRLAGASRSWRAKTEPPLPTARTTETIAGRIGQIPGRTGDAEEAVRMGRIRAIDGVSASIASAKEQPRPSRHGIVRTIAQAASPVEAATCLIGGRAEVLEGDWPAAREVAAPPRN